MNSERKYRTLCNNLYQRAHIQKDKIGNKYKFYPRVTNLTDINFTNDEYSLLNKGLKYKLNHKRKNWINNLSLEAECAITLLPYEEQDYMRYQVAKQIKKLHTQQTAHKTREPKQVEELKIVNSIKEKLRSSKAIVTKAVKGNSIVVSYLDNYEKKVTDFI